MHESGAADTDLGLAPLLPRLACAEVPGVTSERSEFVREIHRPSVDGRMSGKIRSKHDAYDKILRSRDPK